MLQQFPQSQVMLMPSEKVDPSNLYYPVLYSTKLDGTFALTYNGKLYSRALKEIPNKNLLDRLAPILAVKSMVFMGELVDSRGTFSEGQGIVRSFSKAVNDIDFHVFDCLPKIHFDNMSGGSRFGIRYKHYLQHCEAFVGTPIYPVLHTKARSSMELMAAIDNAKQNNEEGIVVRDTHGYYKHGRCTVRDHNIFRFKFYERIEVPILSIEEQRKLRPGVARSRLADGRLDRVHTQGSYEAGDTAGSITVNINGKTTGVGFGPGWDEESRRLLWLDKDKYIGMIAEIEFMSFNMKDTLRQPKLIRIREDLT